MRLGIACARQREVPGKDGPHPNELGLRAVILSDLSRKYLIFLVYYINESARPRVGEQL